MPSTATRMRCRFLNTKSGFPLELKRRPLMLSCGSPRGGRGFIPRSSLREDRDAFIKYLADKFPRCFFEAPQEALDWIAARKRALREKQATVIGTLFGAYLVCVAAYAPRTRTISSVCGRGAMLLRFFGAAIVNKLTFQKLYLR
jgi:hypothetical protein